MIASNVSELIEVLKSLDPAARVFTTEPPFDGLKVVDQGNGSFLFCRPRAPEKLSRPAVGPSTSRIDALAAARDEACQIASGTELRREAAERIQQLREV